MIKRLIFDLDGTLIMWKKEYWLIINNALTRLNIAYDEELIKNIIKSIEYHHSLFNTLTRQNLLYAMNKYTNKDLPIEFIDTFLEEMPYCSEELSEDIIETLDYLKSKYDLVILTDWFDEVQIKRLERAGILKYFTDIFGTNSNLLKPAKEAFLRSLGDFKPSECIMIGNDLVFDIEGAKKVGIDAIYCNYKNEYVSDDIKSITYFKELKKLL